MNKPQKRCEEIVNYLIKSDHTVFKDLNIKKLASLFGVNRSFLSRTFKKYQGVPLNEFIKRLKLLKSALLMSEKSFLTVYEVAEKFGFNRSDYFIKSFKKIFGMTPGKFKDFIQ
jgi:AraC-like DNA-binding protein